MSGPSDFQPTNPALSGSNGAPIMGPRPFLVRGLSDAPRNLILYFAHLSMMLGLQILTGVIPGDATRRMLIWPSSRSS